MTVTVGCIRNDTHTRVEERERERERSEAVRRERINEIAYSNPVHRPRIIDHIIRSHD